MTTERSDHKAVGTIVRLVRPAVGTYHAQYEVEFKAQTCHNRDGRSANLAGHSRTCRVTTNLARKGEALESGDEVACLITPEDPTCPGGILYKRAATWGKGR